jgi:hypothetical protein
MPSEQKGNLEQKVIIEEMPNNICHKKKSSFWTNCYLEQIVT